MQSNFEENKNSEILSQFSTSIFRIQISNTQHTKTIYLDLHNVDDDWTYSYMISFTFGVLFFSNK